MMMIVIYVSAALLSLSLLTYLIPLIYQNYLSSRRDVRYIFRRVSISQQQQQTTNRQQLSVKRILWNGPS
jgi:hypothetical protein